MSSCGAAIACLSCSMEYIMPTWLRAYRPVPVARRYLVVAKIRWKVCIEFYVILIDYIMFLLDWFYLSGMFIFSAS